MTVTWLNMSTQMVQSPVSVVDLGVDRWARTNSPCFSSFILELQATQSKFKLQIIKLTFQLYDSKLNYPNFKVKQIFRIRDREETLF